MNSGLKHELIMLTAWMLVMLITGMISGLTVYFLFAGLLIYLLRNLYKLYRLNLWLANPKKQTPEATGIWEDIYYQLSQLYKRQRKTRRKLTAILKRFQKSTRALPYATIILNKSSEIEWFNPAARQMFNLHINTDVGQRINNLIRHPDFAVYLQNRNFKKPLKFTSRKKKIILGITPYGNGQYLLTARDITSLSQLDEIRRDFISNASHELRTPLTVMSGYIESLQDRADDSMKMPLEKIHQQTVRMNTIITELIDLAKLESAAAVDNTRTVNISDLLNDIYKEALVLDNNSHNISLQIDTKNPDGDPVENIYGSYEELRMAFSNLLTNAIRYTPEGGDIELFANLHNDNISIGVRDSGVGIEHNHIPRLTERFYRVDAGRSRQQGGTGLGLSIVKHVLDRHNAMLNILSTPGKGSTFSCEFPLSSLVVDNNSKQQL